MAVTKKELGEKAYREYRKQYKRKRYEQKYKFQRFLQSNPHLQHVPDIEELYHEYGGQRAKTIILERLLEG